MKIFHTISNKEWGGGEQTVLDLSCRQMADGIKVELFCLPKEDIVARFHELNVPIYQLPLHGALDFKSAWIISRRPLRRLMPGNCRDGRTCAW